MAAARATDGERGQMEGTPDIDPRLLEILVCPLTKAPLRYDRAAQELISEEAGLPDPIRDAIPIMLDHAAPPLRRDGNAPQRPPAPWATPAGGCTPPETR